MLKSTGSAASSMRSTASMKEIGRQYPERRRVPKGRNLYYVCYTNSLAEFFVMTETDWIQHLQFTHQMEQLYSQDGAYVLDENHLNIGFPVAARYVIGDLNWYRAKLVEFDDVKGDYKIEFVDFANTQTNSYHQLRAIPAKIADHSPMALTCRLLGIGPDAAKDEKINDAFRELTYRRFPKGKCLMDILTESPPYVVRMWNAETAEEITPEFFGLQRVTSAPAPSPPPDQIRQDTSTATCVDPSPVSDLLTMDSPVNTTGARAKVPVDRQHSSGETKSSEKSRRKVSANDAAIGGGQLFDEVQKLKQQLPVDTKFVSTGAFRRSSSTAAVRAAGRDAATQTAQVLLPTRIEPSEVKDLLVSYFPALARLLSPKVH